MGCVTPICRLVGVVGHEVLDGCAGAGRLRARPAMALGSSHRDGAPVRTELASVLGQIGSPHDVRGWVRALRSRTLVMERRLPFHHISWRSAERGGDDDARSQLPGRGPTDRYFAALQSPLQKNWLLSEPALAQDLQSLFGADFIGSSRWDEASGQFRDAHCVGRDQMMASDYEKEFQFCDPITPLMRRTGKPTLLRDVQDRPTRPSIEVRFPELTRREVQVASAVASGASDYVIGRRLGLSIWTVRTHLRHVFAKLDVPNRTALAGLVNRPDIPMDAGLDTGE
jgi:DNA-binding CsgD family transcriptional regulator